LQNKKFHLKAERNYTRSAYRLSEIHSKGRNLQHRCAFLRELGTFLALKGKIPQDYLTIAVFMVIGKYQHHQNFLYIM
jgi:hypothetical protein